MLFGFVDGFEYWLECHFRTVLVSKVQTGVASVRGVAYVSVASNDEDFVDVSRRRRPKYTDVYS